MTQPVRVLAVEPSVPQRRALHFLLSAGGMDCRLAADGLEALELFPSFRPHVLLTELVLPYFSGLELIRRVRAFSRKLPILAVTAASGEWATDWAFAAGATFVLRKPAQGAELLRLVRALSSDPARELEALLLAHGAPRGLIGLSQSSRCAALLAQNRCRQLKEVYIEAAVRERSTPQCVAKNIERFVKAFSRQGDLGFLALPSPRAPGNRDFLFALAQCVTFPL